MEAKKILKFITDSLYFPVWWYVDNLSFFVKFTTRSLILIYDGLSIAAVIKSFFKPYRNDRTPVGFGIGIAVRTFWLLSSVAIFTIFLAIVAISFLIYLLFPIVLVFLIFTPETVTYNVELLIDFWRGYSMPYGFPGVVTLVFQVTAAIILISLVYAYFQGYVIKPHKEMKDFSFFAKENVLNWDDVKLLEEAMTPIAKKIWEAVSPLSYSANTLMAQFFKYDKTAHSLRRLNFDKDKLFNALKNLEVSTDRDHWLEVFRNGFLLGLEENHRFLDTELLLLGFVKADKKVEQIFKDLGLDFSELIQVTAWMEQEQIKAESWKFWEDRFFHRAAGVDLGWVAGFTPTLKHFTTDITKAVNEGQIPLIVGREKEIEQVTNILNEATRNNVLLIGPAGVGKSSIVYAIAQRILSGKGEIASKEKIVGKRIVSLDTAALIAGTSARGELEQRVEEGLYEIRHGEVILMVDEIDSLIKAGAADFLSPALSIGSIQVVGSTTPEDYRKYIEQNQTFASYFQTVWINEPSVEETIEIIEGVVPHLEAVHGVTISFPAIEAAVRLTKRFIHDKVLPDKAIEILDETAVFVRGQSKKDKKRLLIVSADDVASTLSVKVKIPLEKIGEEETQKLLNLEAILHQRIIGQDEAISAIAAALRRARTGLSAQNRPLGSFLFLGPTGVGKTETAKVLSITYFGNEEAMIRFDMTEFSEHGSVVNFLDRLTQEVKIKPFAVLLLDEFEKAEGDIHNLFLQVMDDGRLTDEHGRTIDFTNSFIIATSNSKDIHKDFRPELLNRYDGIINFKPLTPDDVFQIARLLMNGVVKTMKEKEIEVTFTDEVVKKVAELGFDPEWGARPLRRVIQEKIENKLADMLLNKKIIEGQKYGFDVKNFDLDNGAVVSASQVQ